MGTGGGFYANDSWCFAGESGHHPQKSKNSGPLLRLNSFNAMIGGNDCILA